MWTRVKLKDGKTEGYGWLEPRLRARSSDRRAWRAWQGFKSSRYVNDKLTVVVFAI